MTPCLTFVGWVVIVALIGPIALAQPRAAAGRWVPAGNLHTPRSGHTATLLKDGKVLVAGGTRDDAILNSAELYDPVGGTWRPTGNLNLARRNFTAALLPTGKVLVAGGYTSASAPSFGLTNTAELYDPVTGTWSFTGELSTPRAAHAMAPHLGHVGVFGGAGPASAVGTAELYNYGTGAWSLLPKLLMPRYGATATDLFNSRVLVAAGSDDGDLASTLATTELYDPVSKTWRNTGGLGTSRISHTATRLGGDMVLIAGGYNWPPVTFASSELYDPKTEQWSSTGSLNAARYSHTAVLLDNGWVLAAGGYDWKRRAWIESAELYDPSTGSWSFTAPLLTARGEHTATLLASGKVLVVGGTGGRSLNAAELYEFPSASGEATRISNLAILAEAGGDTRVSAGFTISAQSAKTILVRAVGPSLAAFGVAGTLPDPRLAVLDARGVPVAENDDFTAGAAAMFAANGAFPLQSGARDAALVTTLPPGSYTAQVSGDTTGSTLLEVYDFSDGTPRLMNIFSRASVRPGAGNVITGFTVSPGEGPQRLLIRAIGPTLASLGFATSDVLPDPKIEVFAGPTKVSENDNWSAERDTFAVPSQMTEAFAQGGAFTLPVSSRDAALIHDFPAGSYTIVTQAADGGRGLVNVEIFALPPASAPKAPVTAGILAVEDFTVTVRKVGDLYEYVPRLRLTEVGRKWRAFPVYFEWTGEHNGTLEALPPGNVVPPMSPPFGVNPGTTVELPLKSLNSTREFSRIWIRLLYMDDDLGGDSIVAVARLIR